MDIWWATVSIATLIGTVGLSIASNILTRPTEHWLSTLSTNWAMRSRVRAEKELRLFRRLYSSPFVREVYFRSLWIKIAINGIISSTNLCSMVLLTRNDTWTPYQTILALVNLLAGVLYGYFVWRSLFKLQYINGHVANLDGYEVSFARRYGELPNP